MKSRFMQFALAVSVVMFALAGCGGNDGDDNNNPGNSGGNDSTQTPGGNGGGDGKFKTVTIGNQTWMAENLNIETVNSWCYDNNPAYCNTYGRLYTWDAARTACPVGWHLPTRAEWDVLVIAAGGTAGQSETGDKNLKSQSWDNGTNSTGFSALPSGRRHAEGSYDALGQWGPWWTANEYDDSDAYNRAMMTGYAGVGEMTYGKDFGFSVRCIQN